MKILFLGQKGIPPLRPAGSAGQAAREHRVEALASALAAAGHKVTVTCAQPFVSRHLRRFNGVALRHVFSLNPLLPGGWVHSFLTLRVVGKAASDVVHVHGWRQAVLAPLSVLINPEATFIWTVDTLPARVGVVYVLVARWAAKMFDVTCAPTRELQYRLLTEFGIRAQYVPDGYTPEALPPVPAAHFGLRKGQYCVLTTTDITDIRWVTKGYEQAKSRKKLVVFAEKTPALSRPARRHPFLIFVSEAGRRVRASLIAQAAAVIVTGNETDSETVLTAMDSGVPLVVTATPLFSELVGATAPVVKPGDV